MCDRGDQINEADTRSLVITPVLDALGYPANFRHSEYAEGSNRPDDICYARPVTENPGHAAAILEAKPYGADFDRPVQPGKRASSPDRQIQRYLKQHSACGPNTVGILTDGARWRIYKRVEGPDSPDTEFVKEYNFAAAEIGLMESAETDLRARLSEFIYIATQGLLLDNYAPMLMSVGIADALFDVILEDQKPDSILRHMLNSNDIDVNDDIVEEVPTLFGVQRDIYEEDWEDHAYAYGPVMRVNTPTLLSDSPGAVGNRLVVGVVKYKDSPDGLGREDTAICARIFAGTSSAKAALTLAYCALRDGTIEARFAAFAEGKVNMAVAFNPEMPSPSAKTAIEDMLSLIRRPRVNPTAERLLAPLGVAPLRQRFYKEVAGWIWKLQKGKTLAERQTILRHLIRAMFVWILKEEDIIPPELFENAFIFTSMNNPADYHRKALSFLFHNRLNTPNEMRTAHANSTLNEAMARAPFLNGSLFSEQDGDADLDIAPELYWNTDEQKPGLFTIFSRYHWTVDEHKPGESEQTLDPELLSNLFERLITPTETGKEALDRQPQGTYYTPSDVTSEMVKDALAAAVRNYAPSRVTDSELLELFSDPNARLPDMNHEERERLARRIREIRIFDPAAGSGAFLFTSLVALKDALKKLENDSDSHTSDIIKRQLSGQDINPLATQITRLRLFIAIKADEKDDTGNSPLPNLEASIVCADTLATVADPAWRPEYAGGLDTAIPGLTSALTALAQNRSQWFDAHTEEAKAGLRKTDQALREDFQALLKSAGDLASPELTGFADFPLFHIQPNPALTDSRLLFYENPWRGFDVVIGNPPYEKLYKSMDKNERKGLTDDKRYKTANIGRGDLYTLFCETALTLANPEGGVVTMIVPLSIAFGQEQRSLRTVFESRCQSINRN